LPQVLQKYYIPNWPVSGVASKDNKCICYKDTTSCSTNNPTRRFSWLIFTGHQLYRKSFSRHRSQRTLYVFINYKSSPMLCGKRSKYQTREKGMWSWIFHSLCLGIWSWNAAFIFPFSFFFFFFDWYWGLNPEPCVCHLSLL
jgi:hypothetical protein